MTKPKAKAKLSLKLSMLWSGLVWPSLVVALGNEMQSSTVFCKRLPLLLPQ